MNKFLDRLALSIVIIVLCYAVFSVIYITIGVLFFDHFMDSLNNYSNIPLGLGLIFTMTWAFYRTIDNYII